MDQLVSSVENWTSWLPFPAFTKFGANGKLPTATNQKYGKSLSHLPPWEGLQAWPSFQFLVSQPDSWLARMNKGDKGCHAKKNATVTVVLHYGTIQTKHLQCVFFCYRVFVWCEIEGVARQKLNSDWLRHLISWLETANFQQMSFHRSRCAPSCTPCFLSVMEPENLRNRKGDQLEVVLDLSLLTEISRTVPEKKQSKLIQKMALTKLPKAITSK